MHIHSNIFISLTSAVIRPADKHLTILTDRDMVEYEREWEREIIKSAASPGGDFANEKKNIGRITFCLYVSHLYMAQTAKSNDR